LRSSKGWCVTTVKLFVNKLLQVDANVAWFAWIRPRPRGCLEGTELVGLPASQAHSAPERAGRRNLHNRRS
jgi:hypothetical protein